MFSNLNYNCFNVLDPVMLLAGGQGGLAHPEFGILVKPNLTLGLGQIMPIKLLPDHPDLKT